LSRETFTESSFIAPFSLQADFIGGQRATSPRILQRRPFAPGGSKPDVLGERIELDLRRPR